MPIYDYECQACGHRFDVLQKGGEGPLRKCPACGKLKLRKCLSAPSFHLKGSGWYKTDYRDGGKKSGDEGEGAGPPRKGHTLDSGPAHSHDGPSHGHDHSHGHSHSHGGKSHSHGPGHKHDAS